MCHRKTHHNSKHCNSNLKVRKLVLDGTTSSTTCSVCTYSKLQIQKPNTTAGNNGNRWKNTTINKGLLYFKY